jgi:hypothetical protein
LGIAVCLLLWPLTAAASSFEFGGNDVGKGVHLHSQGRVNFQWVSVTGSSGDASDPVNNQYWGANDLNIFAAIGKEFGTYTLQAGDSFTGLNYVIPMWLDNSDLPNINAQDQTASGYTSWDFTGSLHITSISFPSIYEIAITGTVTDMVNHLLTSTVLGDLQAAKSTDFTINVVSSYRTDDTQSQGFLTALNSSNLSSWANATGQAGMGAAATPEPGTLTLAASALGLAGWLRRRRTRGASPA